MITNERRFEEDIESFLLTERERPTDEGQSRELCSLCKRGLFAGAAVHGH